MAVKISTKKATMMIILGYLIVAANAFFAGKNLFHGLRTESYIHLLMGMCNLAAGGIVYAIFLPAWTKHRRNIKKLDDYNRETGFYN